MLEMYKDQIGSVAGFFTILQLLSPALLCVNFVKKKGTNGVDVFPFIGGLVLSIVFIQNALLIEDKIMLYVNLFAFVLGTVYLTMYYLYTAEKGTFWITISKAFIFVAAIISYAQRENSDVVKFRFGLIVTSILFAFISAPLLHMKKIIETKNTDLLPIPLIISGTMVALSWLLYGLAIHDSFIIIQNSVAVILQVFQLILFMYIKIQKFSDRKTKRIKRH